MQVVKEGPLLSPLLLGLSLEEVGCGGWKEGINYLGRSGEDCIHIIAYGMQYLNTECVEYWKGISTDFYDKLPCCGVWSGGLK